MTVMKKSSWLYGTFFNSSNKYIDFDEGSGELTAEIVGDYAFDELADVIQIAMNNIGTLTYSVSVNIITRKITIAASGVFSLLVESGTHTAQSALATLGYDEDKSLLATYESDNESVTVYAPQFLLQSYIDFNDYVESVSSTTNISADGQNVEVVSFGDSFFMECLITYANDGVLGQTDEFDYSLNGVTDLRLFLNYARRKRKLLFFPDKSDASVFTRCILESAEGSKDGFRLKEMYDRGLPNFFESGKLKFRKVV